MLYNDLVVVLLSVWRMFITYIIFKFVKYYYIFIIIITSNTPIFFFFFFNDTAPTEIYPLSLHDALPISCSATATNGEGSGVVVPGTGIHLNNVMGEEDLNPLGFHRHVPGTRLPSMMAPSIVMRDGEVELVLGSAGSNRIRSALLQTIVGVVDHALSARAAVDAPRVHFEGGVLYAEPGIADCALSAIDARVVRFGAPNLFFGGVQAVQRRGGRLTSRGE